jgi:predicted ATP-grasp superfamily ATP-dependent carboligase
MRTDRGDRPRALVTDDITGQNRAALSTVRALSTANVETLVTVAGRHSIAGSSRFCAGTVEVPPAGTPAYAEALRSHIREVGYRAVFPASDAALVALEDPAAELVDKAVMPDRAREAGLDVLPQWRFESGAELIAAANTLEYPIVVKPTEKSGVGSMQAMKASSATDLHALAAHPSPLVVQPYENSPLWAISGVMWDGRLLAIAQQRSARLWPIGAGVACAAETVEPDRSFEEPLARLLRSHQGVFQVQFLGPYLIDVNPRVYGSLPLAIAAGANLPAIAVRAAEGSVGDLVRARPGATYRWLEGDVRNLVKQVRGGSMSVATAARAGLPRRGTAYSLESIRDPRPWVTRLRYAAGSKRP